MSSPSSPSSPFAAQLNRHMHGHVVRVRGELDLDTGPQLRAATQTATRQWALPRATLLVDLAEMTFIDGAGLAALMDSRADALRSAREFHLSGASARTRRMMTITGLWELVDSQITPDQLTW